MRQASAESIAELRSSHAPRAVPRRVLMTADTVGGVFTYAVELCRGLGKYGVEVVLATMGAPLTPAQRAELASLPHVGVFESELRLEWMAEPWDDVDRAGAWLLELEATLRPDVVHLNGYAHGALPWRAPTLIVAHSCVLSWWRAVKGEDAPASWDMYRQRVRAGLAAARMVVAPTQAMLDALVACHGPVAAGCVIWNGRDALRFPSGTKEPLVLAAGRLWDEAKNLAALAACSAAVPWPVYVAGPVEEPGTAQHTPGVQPTDHVQPLGSLSATDMARWLARASIYALPARYEPFGLSVLEAALAGCALVLGDIASLREVWGEAAVYVPPGDPEALSRAITELAENGTLRRAMAARARGRALGLTPARMVRGYLAAYAQLAPALASEPLHMACASSA